MDFNTAFQKFKSEYNSSEYGITERKFASLYVYRNGNRHKVADYLRLNTGDYFIIYKKTPIKERKGAGYADSKECGYFAGEINKMLR